MIFTCYPLADWGLGSRRGGLYPLLGEGIFTQDGRPWKHSREMLRRQFARMNFKNLSIFDEHVNELITDLSSGKGVVDLQPAFFRFTLATTTALIFGESVANFPNEEHNTFGNCFDYASMISAIRLRLADLHFLYTPKKFTQACDTVKRYANHFIQEALKYKDINQVEATSESHGLIPDLYRELKDPVLVRDQLINVLIAGRDTTACTMSWAL
jgi:cytochrome P450